MEGLFDGKYSSKDVLRSILLDIGLVFQNFNLFPHYTVLENVVKPQMSVLKPAKWHAPMILSNPSLTSTTPT